MRLRTAATRDYQHLHLVVGANSRYSLMVHVANEAIKCLLWEVDLVIPDDIPLTIVDKVTEFIEQVEGQRDSFIKVSHLSFYSSSFPPCPYQFLYPHHPLLCFISLPIAFHHFSISFSNKVIKTPHSSVQVIVATSYKNCPYQAPQIIGRIYLNDGPHW